MPNRRTFLKQLAAAPLFFHISGKTENTKHPSIYQAEVTIIGSGPAGLSIADMLTAKGIKTLVVDSGIEELNAERQTLAKIESGDRQHSRIFSDAGIRALGGTSHVWGGVCPRLQPSDLTTYSQYGYACDWPLTYNELSHYYCRAEQWLGVPATLKNSNDSCQALSQSPFIQAGESLKNELSKLNYKSIQPASVIVNKYGFYNPTNLYKQRLPALLKRSDFTLIGDCTARQIDIDKTGTATGIIATTFEGKEITIKSRLIILCGGAIQNPRLLLLSKNAHYPDGIGNHSGHVGRWFMDHPNYQVWIKPKQSWLNEPYQAALLHIRDWHEQFRKEGTAILGRIGQFRFRPIDGVAVATPEQTFMLEALIEQEPQYGNAITLNTDQNDRFGDPLPTINLQHSPRDKKGIEHAIDSLTALADFFGETHSVRPLRISSHHLMGTTRMAKNPEDGVVDENLKVHGTRNIYVAGASVFPSGGAANPTLTLTALSQRMADHIVSLRGRFLP